MLCQESTEELERIWKIGVTVKLSCEYDLSKLTDEFGRPSEENFFYDLFIEDYNKVLIDVPVLIRNLRDENGG